MPIKVPFTTTVTSHGLLIQSAPGIPVGAITSWRTRQARKTQELYEFGAVTVGGGDDILGDSGEAYEIVPGNVGNTTISVRRYDIYTNRFEKAFGSFDLQMLTRQDKAIRLIEFTTGPTDELSFKYVYYGCWFTSLGREYSADGNRVVMADAEAVYTRRREV